MTDSPGTGTAPTRPAKRRKRPVNTAVLSGVLTYACVIGAALLPVPYMVQMPGPVVNTYAEGEDLITIEGAPTYPTRGQLDLLTVAVAGGPDRSLYASQILGALVDRTDTVIPQEMYYPLDTTRDEISHVNAAQMTSSQDMATAAALTELGMDVEDVVVVNEVEPDGAAAEALRPGDVLRTLDGAPIGGEPESGAQRVSAAAAEGEPLVLGIERDGVRQDVEIAPTLVDGEYRMGVTLGYDFLFPVEVEFHVADEIGGPSAGTIFALAIIDELTPGDLTGGVPIAGTGAISADGTISPIGGARQKVAAAAHPSEERAAAQYFLSPAANCAEVLDAASGIDDLTVVRVDDLASARASVEAIGEGHTDDLPSCETAAADSGTTR
ncbi:YlbL family protein [Brevibacterium samyangense]|uniref:PDZ domain-containing protein n=1 Tax=Brevibacterium samyangense TaxID=366888 RepID=A0ABN2TBE2_9MICO